MKNINAAISFVFFLEEYLLWSPGHINTLFEKIARVIALSLDSEGILLQLVYFINPFFCYILLLASVPRLVDYIKTIFTENARNSILIWIERHNYIQVILALVLGGFFLLMVLRIFENSSLSLLDLYQSKILWTILFGYIVAKRIISIKSWQEVT